MQTPDAAYRLALLRHFVLVMHNAYAKGLVHVR